MPAHPLWRAFSAKADLQTILSREHAEEMDNGHTTLPEELAQLKATIEQDWKVVEDGAITKLYRTVGPLKVQLSFHCQDTVELVENLEDEVSDEAASPVRFTVSVTRAGQTMVLTCLSEDAQARIESVAMTAESPDVVLAKGAIDSTVYQGPEFLELAEDLQDAFYGFIVDEVGIGEDVASFVAMHADYREEVEYVHFLDKAKGLMQE